MTPPDRLKGAIEVVGQCVAAVAALYGDREVMAALQWWLRQRERKLHGLIEEEV